MQKNQNSKGKPAPSGAFTHRIREDGEIFSGEEGRETSSDTTPLPPWQDLFACDRLTAIDLFVRHQKGSRCQPTTPGRSVGGSEES
ncbi:hypothetical protein BASA81_016646 [Batrachochytrium salamandrivorans]|nr:hypothetical protein BASA81_016646 [Batrachochytrium salamandrivorans]